MFWLKENKKNLLVILLIILLTLPAVFSLLRPGFFKSDDGEWMVIRASAFYQALREGQFPVRFLERLNFGYGYPVSNFLYPGFLYLSVLFRLLSFSFVASIKIIFGLSMIFSGVLCFLWLNKLFDKYSALVGGLIYVYLPYHLYDLYVRGSIGEMLALALVPFILWQIERKSFFWTTIGISSLILAHNTLALLFLPIIITYMLFDVFVSKEKHKPLIYKYSSILILSFGSSSFFWVPAIIDLQYTIFSKTTVSAWGSYFADINLIGLTTILALILTGALFLLKKIRISKHRLTLMIFIIGLVSLFFAVPISAPLWSILPVSFIQFPFRFLSVTILCTAFLSACIFSVLSNKISVALAPVFLFSIIFSVFLYISPKEFVARDNGFYVTNEATTTVKDEYMPRWVSQKPTKHYVSKVEIISGKVKMQNIKQNSKEIRLEAQVESTAKMRVNTVYFPGWDVFINGRKSVIDFSNKQGVIEFNLEKGSNAVYVVFHETPMRLLTDLVSLASLIILLFVCFGKKILLKYD